MAGGLIGKLMGRDKGAGRGPAVHVAAFGKHPGWNDHIDDLGIESELLIGTKRLLYVEGINATIDSGAWDRLDESQRLERFHHAFILRRPGDVIVGRFWSSVDGKGRSRYPMVVCAHAHGVPTVRAIERCLPVLEGLEERCRATDRREDVVAGVADARSRLRAELAPEGARGAGEGSLEMEIDPAVLARCADAPAMGPERRGFFRLLYQLEREHAPSSDRARGGGAAGESRSLHVRVPRCESDPGAELIGWMRVLLTRLEASTPILAAVALEGSWADLIVGTPTGSQLFCLKATPESVPLTTEIPYTLDAGFVSSAEGLVEASRSAPPIRIPMEPDRRAPAHPIVSRALG